MYPGIILFLTLMSANVNAALTIEVTQGVEGALPIAVVPFDTSRLDAELPTDIAEIVANDLNRSGIFKTMDRQKLPAQPHYSTQVIYPKWRTAGQEYLVVGRIFQKSSGQYDIQFQLLDVLKQKQLVGYSLPVKKRNLRSSAHEISDLIYEKITGTRGAFNTRIAYVRSQKDKARKYILQVADTDGFNAQTILESDQPLMSPSWSPTGQSLAYVSFENNRPEVFVQHLASAKRSKISGFEGINGAPSWSPNGKMLALVLSKDGNPDIYTLNTTTKRLTRLTRNRAIDTEPVWSTKGRSIIFTSDRGGSPQIYRMPVTGGASGVAERLTFEGNYNVSPQYRHDGKSFTFIHRNGTKFNVAVQDLDTRQVQLLTDSRFDESPSFAPNGKIILYATEIRGRGILAAVSSDGRTRQRLSDQSGDIREPAWGPLPKWR